MPSKDLPKKIAEAYAKHVPDHLIDAAGCRMEGSAMHALVRNGRQDLPEPSGELKAKVRATVKRGVAANVKLGLDDKPHASDLVELAAMLGNGNPVPGLEKNAPQETAAARLEREGLWGPMADVKAHLEGRTYAIDAFVSAMILAAIWTDKDIVDDVE